MRRRSIVGDPSVERRDASEEALRRGMLYLDPQYVDLYLSSAAFHYAIDSTIQHVIPALVAGFAQQARATDEHTANLIEQALRRPLLPDTWQPPDPEAHGG